MAYIYQPIYGVEPYAANGVSQNDDFGGGAKVTGDNLLITLWEVTAFDGPVPSAGNLLKPFLATASGAAAVAGAAAQDIGLAGIFTQVFKSRISARFIFGDIDGDPLIGDTFLAILQPPPDMANDALTWAKGFAASSNNNYGKSIQYLRSGFSANAWDFLATDDVNVDNQEIAQFGDVVAQVLPAARTSGADGAFPTFFDALTEPGFADALEEIVDGAQFFIPCLFSRDASFDSTDSEYFSFAWKGSNARR